MRSRVTLTFFVGLVLAAGVVLIMLNRPLTSTAGGDCGTGLKWDERYRVTEQNGVVVPAGEDTCADAVSTSHSQAAIAGGTIVVLTAGVALFLRTPSTERAEGAPGANRPAQPQSSGPPSEVASREEP
jgi:hypothetical protein